MVEVWIAVGTIAAVLASIAAGFAAWFTRQIMRSSQDQVRVSLEQARQGVEAQQDAQLPLLMPTDQLYTADHAVMDSAGHTIQQAEPGYRIGSPFILVKLRNVGAGIALNVRGIIFPAEPPTPGSPIAGQIHSFIFPLPLVSGGEDSHQWRASGPPVDMHAEIVEKKTGKRYKLYITRERAPDSAGSVATKIARLTFTYADVFGRKHAAVFDLTTQLQWEQVAYARDILQDLSELEWEALKIRPYYSAPPLLPS